MLDEIKSSKDIIVEGKPPKQKQSEGNWTLTDAFQLSHSVITASFLLAATHQEQVTKLFSRNIKFCISPGNPTPPPQLLLHSCCALRFPLVM